jgi:hypothetical protein
LVHRAAGTIAPNSEQLRGSCQRDGAIDGAAGELEGEVAVIKLASWREPPFGRQSALQRTSSTLRTQESGCGTPSGRDDMAAE